MANLATDVRLDEILVQKRVRVWTLHTVHIAALFMLFGALLRVVQFVHNRSLWGDEAMLAINITGRSFAGLLRPLSFDQGAPLGFLMLEKAAVLAFGNNERALRLLPLLAGLASLPLTYAVARRCLSERAGLLALGLVALSEPLIYYSNEVKQYSCDVAVGLAILLCALNVTPKRRILPNLLPLLVVGIVGITLSHTAILFLLGVTVVLGIQEVRGTHRLHPLPFALFTLAWMTVAGLNWLLFLRPLAANHTLMNFWANGFMPTSPRALLWLPQRIAAWFTDPAQLPAVGLAVIALFFGGRTLLRTQKLAFWLIVAPILTALAFSMIHAYPFAGRLILFTIPLAALLIGAGLDTIWQNIAQNEALIGGAIALVLFAPMIANAGQMLVKPPNKAEMRPLMQRIAREAQPGDTIFVSGKAMKAFLFYSDYADVHLLRGVHVVTTPPGMGGWNTFQQTIGQFRGQKRVWFVFSFAFKSDSIAESAFFQFVLDGMGQHLEQLDEDGATAAFYNLSERQIGQN